MASWLAGVLWERASRQPTWAQMSTARKEGIFLVRYPVSVSTHHGKRGPLEAVRESNHCYSGKHQLSSSRHHGITLLDGRQPPGRAISKPR
jgi:hypothetical protein